MGNPLPRLICLEILGNSRKSNPSYLDRIHVTTVICSLKKTRDVSHHEEQLRVEGTKIDRFFASFGGAVRFPNRRKIAVVERETLLLLRPRIWTRFVA